jgi:glycosyltransferase involved in cell wall biosynthesis
MDRTYKVTIIQATIKQYRESFYLQLRERLSKYRIELTVIYSKPGRIDESKKDNIDLPAALKKKVRRIYFLNDRILIQFLPMAELIRRSDLIIIDQATGFLHNYPLLMLSRLGLKKVAFWGHGYNRQGNPKSFSERLKRYFVTWTRWWFAYTQETAHYLESVGVSPDKITNFENAIDTSGFRNILESVTLEEIVNMRHHLKIREGDRVGLYCGSLYAEKRVPYLLNAAMRIAALEPHFRLLVVGGGSEADIVRRASNGNPCIVYAGPLFGRDKAICFRMAEIFLNPGLVGLAILDSFTAGLPFVTTKEALHSPEIDYLDNGVNGLMVSGNEEVFVNTVVDLMRDPGCLALMRQGALESASRYTIENMVKNMSNGILACLKSGDSQYCASRNSNHK